jgi:hypothetical protein
MLVPFLILFSAASVHGAVTRVRVRCSSCNATIVGVARDTVAAENVRVIDPELVEVTANDGETIAVPRAAAVEWLSSGRATAEVRDVAALHIDAAAGQITAERIAGNIDGKTANANIIARGIGGSVVLATGNGNIDLRGVRGLIDVTSGNAITTIADAASGVHVTSINGKTVISCVAGSVGVQDTSGLTDVSAVAGDVDVFTALGAAHYDGALQPDRSYRLRTLDGAVLLSYAPASSGFSAQLASDVMHIFVDQKPVPNRRRMLLHLGDERARVVLDAVGGHVEVRKRVAMPACR